MADHVRDLFREWADQYQAEGDEISDYDLEQAYRAGYADAHTEMKANG